ncbi:MAG: HNH endonuclease [Desulfobulbaceae bacterium]|nr:MAG: HNH endonuclease [Desulfobulbaceae bacterium]
MSSRLTRNRSKAFKNQKGLCFYCNKPMWEENIQEFSSRNGLTIKQAYRLRCTAEHLIARCDGGTDSSRNIVAACLRCNQSRHRTRKQAPSPTIYRKRVLKIMRKGGWHNQAIHKLSASPA